MSGEWIRTQLGSVFTTMTGSTPSKADTTLFGTFMPLVKPPELLDGPLESAEDGLSESGARGARTLPAWSVLVSCIGNLGKVGINTVPVAFNQQINAVLPDRARAIPEFVFYQALSPAFKAQLESLATGTTIRIVNKSKFNEIEIVLASLSEQQRIVAILDEAFEGIATAKANAEKNLQNARELLATVTRQAFAKLSEDHKSCLLGSVCRFENGDRGKNYPGKEHRVERGIPFINAGHLTSTGVDFSAMDYISPARFALLGNGKIQPKDVLFCLRGSLGKFASVGDLSSGAIASSLVILRPTSELDHGYLLGFLGSTLCSEQIEAYKGGAAQPNLGAKDLKQFDLPLPPLEVQRRVSDHITEFHERAAELLDLTNKKLAALDELKKSLLHQVFSGQL